MKKYFFAFLYLILSSYASADAVSRLDVKDGRFVLDGEPTVIKAAELHYSRIPRPYWDHRIKMCKALGMNTICMYLFWNLHEPEEGNFDFSGQNDIRAFVELCRENGMNVILRPGPYVCAEWEMGGLPWWLLKDKDIELRTSDSLFIKAADRFMAQAAAQLEGLTPADGGPIIMIQVENEYGSYGDNRPYIETIRDMVRSNFGDGVLFQCDWSSNFQVNGLDDLLWTMNFGTGADVETEFRELKKIRPGSPLMCSEYWSGWFDKWGAPHETRPADEMIKGIRDMLDRDISFSLYMTHGGTSFGHWAGANSPGYSPDVTSYDYDAPINEHGEATPKYRLLRSLLASYSSAPLPDIPASVPTDTIARFRLTEFAPMMKNLPAPVLSDTIMTMEHLNQGFGSTLYRTSLPAYGDSCVLTVKEPHDYAIVYVNGEIAGTLDRRHGETSLPLPPLSRESTLDILVESTGRINFGTAIKDFKGITDAVWVSRGDGQPEELTGWEIFPIPDDYDFYLSLAFDKLPERPEAGVYRGTFRTDNPADTFLDFSTWGKGLVYVNCRGIGRIWNEGPQQTLYMPGCWLRKGENEIIVFDVLGAESPVVRGLDKPIYDVLSLPDMDSGNVLPAEILSETDYDVALNLEDRPGWQAVALPAELKGRYAVIRIDSTYRPDEPAAIAELYFTDREGRDIDRESWRSIEISPTQNTDGNPAEKIFDLQESTCWSAPTAGTPSYIVIDFGREETAGGIRVLPRQGKNAKGAVKRFSLKITDTLPR